jgi:serine/threonine protein kinase
MSADNLIGFNYKRDKLDIILQQKIGANAIGNVYDAIDKSPANTIDSIGAPVVAKKYKVIVSSIENLESLEIAPDLFEERIKQLIKLPDSITAKYYSFYKNPNGIIFVIVEYINGVAMNLENFKSWDSTMVTTLATQLANIIKHLHDNKLAHLNIKPNNFININSANNYHYKIIDMINSCSSFGIFNESCTQQLKPETIKYMPPEFIDIKAIGIDFDKLAKYDIWSLGILFFELAAKRDFYHSNSQISLIERVQTLTEETIERELQSIPNALLKSIIADMLKIDPSQRTNIDNVYSKLVNDAIVCNINTIKYTRANMKKFLLLNYGTVPVDATDMELCTLVENIVEKNETCTIEQESYNFDALKQFASFIGLDKGDATIGHNELCIKLKNVLLNQAQTRKECSKYITQLLLDTINTIYSANDLDESEYTNVIGKYEKIFKVAADHKLLDNDLIQSSMGASTEEYKPILKRMLPVL